MSVRLRQKYSLSLVVLIMTLLSFFMISKDRIEISVVNEFYNPDDLDGEAGLDPGDDERGQIDSCEGVEEPVSDVRLVHCSL